MRLLVRYDGIEQEVMGPVYARERQQEASVPISQEFALVSNGVNGATVKHSLLNAGKQHPQPHSAPLSPKRACLKVDRPHFEASVFATMASL